jgi:hypothetical protein
MTGLVVPRWHVRLAGLLLAVASVLVVSAAAVFVSASTAVIVGVLVVLLAVHSVRRARGRARVPRA